MLQKAMEPEHEAAMSFFQPAHRYTPVHFSN